jgi:hypothetical protein
MVDAKSDGIITFTFIILEFVEIHPDLPLNEIKTIRKRISDEQGMDIIVIRS